MSRCGRAHTLEAAVLGEVPDEALRQHAQSCPRCRHELRWLETEQGLFRQRAARDEVQQLWQGVATRAGVTSRRRSINRVLVGVAAALCVMVVAGRVLVAFPRSSAGRDASVVMTADERALFDGESKVLSETSSSDPAPIELCSRNLSAIGFHCGNALTASVLASR
jgi:hypothetical protein